MIFWCKINHRDLHLKSTTPVENMKDLARETMGMQKLKKKHKVNLPSNKWVFQCYGAKGMALDLAEWPGMYGAKEQLLYCHFSWAVLLKTIYSYFNKINVVSVLDYMKQKIYRYINIVVE